jgi:hypothetical protein
MARPLNNPALKAGLCRPDFSVRAKAQHAELQAEINECSRTGICIVHVCIPGNGGEW